MEIKLKIDHSNADTGVIVDEYGALWKYSGTKIGHSIFSVFTKGLNDEAIEGFYQNGTLFIISLSGARKYFSSVNFRDLPHGGRCQDLDPSEHCPVPGPASSESE